MFCSNCGKTDKDLKGCNACRCIRYCSASCQKAHWKTHKKECRQIEAVLKKGEPRDGKYYLDLSVQVDGEDSGLFDEPPKNPDCVVCMVRLPLETRYSIYHPCCGKVICSACSRDSAKATYEINQKKAAMKQKLLDSTCPFCRERCVNGDDPEWMPLLIKRAHLGDAVAMRLLAEEYRKQGNIYLSMQLLNASANLGGFVEAQYAYGCIYAIGALGVEVDEISANRYFELAAKNGHVIARHNLGCSHRQVDGAPSISSIKHWRISAAAGSTRSIMSLIAASRFIRHKDLAASLRARDKARLEMKSESRDRLVAFFKSTGQLPPVY